MASPRFRDTGRFVRRTDPAKTYTPASLAELMRRLDPATKTATPIRVRGAREKQRHDDHESPPVPSADVPLQTLPPFPSVSSITVARWRRQTIRQRNHVDCPGPASLYCVRPNDHRGLIEVEWSH